MATAERPPARIDGKANPAYQKWKREEKKGKKPGDSPAPLTLQCVKLARNSRFVLCLDPENKGKTVPVRVLARMRPEKLLKKPVKCERTPDGKYQMIR